MYTYTYEHVYMSMYTYESKHTGGGSGVAKDEIAAAARGGLRREVDDAAVVEGEGAALVYVQHRVSARFGV